VALLSVSILKRVSQLPLALHISIVLIHPFMQSPYYRSVGQVVVPNV
jgi:hypothetical protein